MMIKPGEEIIAGSNERFRVVDVVPRPRWLSAIASGSRRLPQWRPPSEVTARSMIGRGFRSGRISIGGGRV